MRLMCNLPARVYLICNKPVTYEQVVELLNNSYSTTTKLVNLPQLAARIRAASYTYVDRTYV